VKKTCRTFAEFAHLGFLLLTAGCDPQDETFDLGGYRFGTESFQQWKLPKSLKEISGLAATADGRLFAHADEQASIYQIDYRDGKLVKSFSLGSSADAKPVKGDFEGIALRDSELYLVTSNGILYRTQIGGDGSTMPYQTFNSGAGSLCEVEGLAYHQHTDTLLIACKKVRDDDFKNQLVVLQWSPQTRRLEREMTVLISEEAAGGRFSTSGIAVSPRNGNMILVAARQKKVLEAKLTGEVVTVFSLHLDSYHRQAEGIEMLSNGTLILADEGGKKRGRLGTYRARD
jgi:uncharacterized protein YjiK